MLKTSDLEKTIGYAFRDPHLLEVALTHASSQREHGDNERMEFLGDRVAGLVIADMLYSAFPEEDEGHLAKRHAALVQRAAMVEVADRTGIAAFLRLSSGEARAGGTSKGTILGDAVEALVGAVYLDGGFAAADAFVRRFWGDMLRTNETPPQDPKTALQEWVQARGLPLPAYAVLSRSGSDHDPVFEVSLSVQGQEEVRATARSKRMAEKQAAQAMLDAVEGRV